MRLQNSTDHYGMVAVLLHWLVALTVFVLYGLGLYIVSLSYYDPDYKVMPFWHKSIGVSLGVIVLVRLGWRLFSAKPAPVVGHSAVERRLAASAHILLYVLPLATVIAGYLISTADGRPVEVFSLFPVPALPVSIENQEDIAGDLHFWLATMLIALALLHGLAALKHHFVDKDTTLKRMLPRFKSQKQRKDD